MIETRYQEILKNVEPYLLGNPKSFENYSMSFFNKSIKSENQFNCLSQNSVPFFELLHTLDHISFGDQGMGMDKWVFFDCAAMPAGVFGFGLYAHQLPLSYLQLIKLDKNYKGLVPISMYMAIPTTHTDHWFGHNLSSLSRYLDLSYKGLGLLTKASAARVFKINQCYGATQWGSHAIEIHSQLANMELRAARLSSHSHANSLCYLSDYSEENILKALSGKRNEAYEYDFLLSPSDTEKQIELNESIESGERYEICGRPIHQNGDVFYPIRKLS